MEVLFDPYIKRGWPFCLDFWNQVSVPNYTVNCNCILCTYGMFFCFFKVLLTMIWLQRYPMLDHLSMHFGIPLSSTHRIVHRCVKLLHAYVVPKYIRWHNMQYWRNLAGTYPEWPRVVAILDCIPFRISRPQGAYKSLWRLSMRWIIVEIYTNILFPTGPMQRMYCRRDRHCFFLNWLVIVDVLGYVMLSRPGFIGRVHDSVCYRNINVPVLPQGLRIMADQGFQHGPPVILLSHHN